MKMINKSLDRDLISFLDNLSFLVVTSDATVWIFLCHVQDFEFRIFEILILNDDSDFVD